MEKDSLIEQIINDYAEKITEYLRFSYPDITYKVVNVGNGYKIVFSPDYIYWQEDGRNKGKQPPIKAIEEWIKKHNIVPYNSKKIPNRKSLAFVISKKIGEKGTTGLHKLDTIDKDGLLYDIANEKLVIYINNFFK